MSLNIAHSQKNPTYVKNLFALIAQRYELANHLLCGGMDFWWRHLAARKIAAIKPRRVLEPAFMVAAADEGPRADSAEQLSLHKVLAGPSTETTKPIAAAVDDGYRFLDVATGSGNLAVAILKKIPTAHVTGVDFCREMLEQAKKKKCDHLELIEADGLALPFADEAFDAVTIAFGLRNMESFEKGLHEMRRVLRHGGLLLILDFSLPTSPLIRPLYRFYLHHLLPHIAGWITGKADAYEYMAESIEQFPSGKKMCSLLEQCGLQQATSEPLTAGIVTIYTAIKDRQ